MKKRIFLIVFGLFAPTCGLQAMDYAGETVALESPGEEQDPYLNLPYDEVVERLRSEKLSPVKVTEVEAFHQLITGLGKAKIHDGPGRESLEKEFLDKIRDDKKLIAKVDSYGNNALHVAARTNKPEILDTLLNTFHNNEAQLIALQEKNSAGRTVLHEAALLGNAETVRFLLDKVAGFATPEYLESIDNKGMTPLHLAAEQGRLDVVRLLRDKGSNVCTKNNKDRRVMIPITPILSAAREGFFDVVELLIENPPACLDIDDFDSRRNTVLYYAVAGPSDDLIRRLLDLGADLLLRRAKDTPMDHARKLSTQAREADEKAFREGRVMFLEQELERRGK